MPGASRKTPAKKHLNCVSARGFLWLALLLSAKGPASLDSSAYLTALIAGALEGQQRRIADCLTVAEMLDVYTGYQVLLESVILPRQKASQETSLEKPALPF